jgi:hypothetical protein
MLLLAPVDLYDDQRKEDRLQVPDIRFLFAVFRLGHGLGNQDYELRVLDYSRHGLGLLISEREYPLVHILGPGYAIKEIRLFAEAAMALVNGTVRHVTPLDECKPGSHFLLGLELDTTHEFDSQS